MRRQKREGREMPFRTGKNYLRFIEHWKKNRRIKLQEISAQSVSPSLCRPALMRQRTEKDRKFHVNSMLINLGLAKVRWDGNNLWSLYKVSYFRMKLSGCNGKAFICVALVKSSLFIVSDVTYSLIWNPLSFVKIFIYITNCIMNKYFHPTPEITIRIFPNPSQIRSFIIYE